MGIVRYKSNISKAATTLSIFAIQIKVLNQWRQFHFKVGRQSSAIEVQGYAPTGNFFKKFTKCCIFRGSGVRSCLLSKSEGGARHLSFPALPEVMPQ